ncbi:stress response translation initiation inhibitor YciH [Alteromonas sediminis]|uniref:Stress response translation initiation inhibitor YciH n=1 Tax=Alteromonas sediminis TaxID=2259342 RepID=A0A3N5Y3M2_9ALTE|nr:stress response translation initiation inhibitor YciH [Alteromonas sediminis]RPJ68542.1 stress response translation initiation inhibitor YciH [Alteromonas sediminis]
MSNANHLVYSTETGRVKANSKQQEDLSYSNDGFVRIHRETKGRKGAGVSIVRGLEKTKDELKPLCKMLKQKCGCGGAIKDGTIELQTDNREKISQLLQTAGYKVKIAGS